MHCPGGNATDPIWRVLASSQWISSWTPLKPRHSNPNPYPLGQSTLVYWLPYSSHTSHHPSQTPCLPWISYATQKLMLDSCKMVEKQSEVFHTFLWHFFPSLKQNFIAYRSSKVSSRPDWIFEIHQQWQSGFSRVYSNCCYSSSFEAEIIKIDQSSHKMYNNNILNFQESTTILDGHTEKVWKIIVGTSYIFIVGKGSWIYQLHLYWGVRFPQQVSWIWHQTIWRWSSSNAWVLKNDEYPFVAIASRSTLAWSGSIW